MNKRPRRGRVSTYRAEALESRVLLASEPLLVKDINSLPDILLGPSELVAVGSTVFFVHNDAQHGSELWKSDGTGAGTLLVKDIFPGANSSSPMHLIDVNGTVYFVADDGASGLELWKSDGTAAGTVLVKDIRPGTGNAFQKDAQDPPYFTNANGVLFFNAEDGVNGSELWKSDGTAAGTVLVKVIDFRPPDTAYDGPRDLAYVNGMLLFNANDGVTGRELWKSDGTATGTVLLKDLNPGDQNSHSTPWEFTSFNGAVYFFDVASQGILWKTDGTTGGTVPVSGTFQYFPHSATVVGSQLFYVAGTSLQQDFELYKSDGTGAGTGRVKDINPGYFDSSPADLTPLNGLLYFSAQDEVSGRELWRSDGTEAGTQQVMDIWPGSSHSSPTGLINVNGALYFAADDGVNGSELWTSDGTPSGTTLVRDILPGSSGSNPTTLINLNGTLYFAAADNLNGRELWKSNGTAPGTVVVKNISPRTQSAILTDELTSVNGILYFAASDGVNGRELWKSDGTAVGTVMVKDIWPGGTDSDPRELTNVNGILYFRADDGVNGTELWKSDGTAAGTVMVKDIRPGSSGSGPVELTDVNGTLYFSAYDDLNGYELWKSDGTAAGTLMVKDISTFFGGSQPSSLTNVNGVLYFEADDHSSSYNWELWKSDGTTAGTVKVKEINPNGSSYPRDLTDVNGTVYFRANDGVNGEELWKSNGTSAGTVMVKDILAGSGDSFTSQLLNVNGTLYFAANDGVSGEELWKSDGTAAGTVMVKNIAAGSNPSSPRSLTNFNGTLFFAASDPVNGRELWKSDGTDPGTVLVKDIYPGSSSSPSGLVEVNGTLFFIASAPGTGVELWKSDGTASGTVLVRDLRPGLDTSSPAALTDVNGTLFFRADNGVTGVELWTYNVTAVVPIAWDGGGDGVSWSDPLNWSSDIVPASKHAVTIDVAGNPTIVVDGTQSVHSIISNEALNITGTLTIADSSTFDAPVSLSGGTLNGAGDATFNSSLDWTAGTMSGAGKTIISSIGTLNITGTGLKTLSRTLENNGSATWTSVSTSSITLTNGTLDNFGSFTAGNSAAQLSFLSGGGTNLLRNRAGATFTKNGNGLLHITPPTQNDGSMVINQNVLQFGGTGTHAGSFSVGNGCTLVFLQAQTLSAASSITGGGSIFFSTTSTGSGTISLGGSLSVSGGTLTLSGSTSLGGLQVSGSSAVVNFNGATSFSAGATFNITSGTANFGSSVISFASGTLSNGTLGGGTVTVTGTFTWSGGLIAAGGTMTIASTGNVQMNTSQYNLTGRTFQNDGTVQWGGGDLFMTSAIFINNGTLNFTATSPAICRRNGGTNEFRNNGVLNKQGPSTLTFSNSGPGGSLTYNSGGSTSVQSGTLQIDVTLTQYNSGTNTLSGGTWAVISSGILNFPSGSSIRTNNGNVSLTGPSSTFSAINSLTTNNGTFTLAGGRAFGASPNGGVFSNSGGATINLGAGSILSISGQFSQAATGTLQVDIAGANPTTDYGRITTSSSFTLNGALTATITGGYDPAYSVAFGIVSGTSRSGTFSSFSGNTTPSNRALRARYSTNTAIVGVAPMTPAAPDLVAGSDSGSSSTDNYTNVTTPTFTGTAENGTTVRLYSDGAQVGSAVVAGGTYSITASTLANGPHIMTVTAEDTDVDVSNASPGLSIVIDTVAPVITNPGNQNFEIVSTAGTIVNFNPATASDNLDPTPVVQHTPSNGSAFLPGTTAVNVTATDLAGNQAVGSFSVTLLDAPFIVPGPGAAYSFSGGRTPLTLTLFAGQLTFVQNAALFKPDLNVVVTGDGTTLISTSALQQMANLSIGSGAVTNLSSGGNKVLVVTGLSTGGTGKLDLNDNDLILDYAGASQLAAIQALINSGRAGGAWTGPGITSTAAKNANPKNTTLGAMEATDYKSIYGAGALFSGQSIDNTAVLVKYTYYGDTDFNGVVNFDDYARIDTGYSQGRSGWLNGDFDGSGSVNFDDYALIDLAFNTQSGTLRPGAASPRPVPQVFWKR